MLQFNLLQILFLAGAIFSTGSYLFLFRKERNNIGTGIGSLLILLILSTRIVYMVFWTKELTYCSILAILAGVCLAMLFAANITCKESTD